MNFTTFFFLFLFLVFTFSNNESHAAKSVCNWNRYTNGSIIERNINAVINYLVQHGPPNGGFNTTVQGQGDDLTTEEECKACSIQANTTVRQECGNSVGGRVWLDKCYLRFEHIPFIGDLDSTSYLVQNNLLNATDPEAFGSTVKTLLSDISVRVTKSSILYSSDSALDRSSSTKIYGLVQCWRDISLDDCADCLDIAIRALVEVTNGAHNIGGVVYSGSCTARYDAFPFFASPSNGGNQLHESSKSALYVH